MSDVLTVADVMARYGMRDRRAARALMDQAGCFKLGASLYARLADLIAHEDAQKAARASQAAPPVAGKRPAPARRTKAAQTPRAQLAPDWWRQGLEERRDADRLAAPGNRRSP